VILVVSHPADDHLRPVLDELRRIGSESLVLDTATFPTQVAVSARHGEDGDAWEATVNGQPVDLTRCGSGWWRRALPFQPDARIADPAQASWAVNECYEATSGVWDALPITWVSPPRVIEQTMMKTWQLPAARAAGLRIPRTLVTNDPRAARAFVDEVGVGRTICKAFSATVENWRETRLVGPAEYAVLDQVALAPVIFQEYVPAEVDLRITAVGDELFVAAIHSQEIPYPVDFRIYLDSVRMAADTVPPEVEKGLLLLLERAGLRYGAIDMRRTPDGEHMFLEVNPAGQWLFAEEATGLPITAALARLLTDLDRVA
jgi:hypothetical protein